MKILPLISILLLFVACSKGVSQSSEEGEYIVGQSIIGNEDSRVQVTKNALKNDITKWVGNLQISFFDETSKEQIFECTGTHVGEGYILTAAHCVYDSDTNRLATHIRYIPKITSDNVDSAQIYYIDQVWVNKEYQIYPSAENDIAILRVVENEVFRLRSHGYPGNYAPSASQTQMKAKMAGYPVDKIQWDMNISYCDVFTDSDTQKFVYECDTAHGMSGAAIFVYLEEYGKYYVAGVHSGSGAMPGYNVGYKFTKDIQVEMNNLIKKGIEPTFFSRTKIETKVSHILQFRNNCGKRLVFAIKYGKTNPEVAETLTDFQVMEDGEVMSFRSISKDYYIYATNEDGIKTRKEVGIFIPERGVFEFEHFRAPFPDFSLIFDRNICRY